MKTDPLEDLFKRFKDNFDIQTPNAGHENRFFDKLVSHKMNMRVTPTNRSFVKPFMTIAAALLILFGLFFFFESRPKVYDLGRVSPELSKTQEFFTSVISAELNKINEKRSPENEVLISDALKQLDVLEKNYEQLKGDLKESGNDNRVIYAMISNFQNRIDILKHVLKSIEDLNQIKTSKLNQITL